MQTRDWTIFGQVAAWLLNVQTRCKEYFKALDVDPSILRWVGETNEGHNALLAACQLLANEYKRFLQLGKEKIFISLPKGEVFIPLLPEFRSPNYFSTRDNPGNIRFGTLYNMDLRVVEMDIKPILVVFNDTNSTLPFIIWHHEVLPELPAARMMKLGQICWLLSKQPQGEYQDGADKVLLVDGGENLFFHSGEKQIESLIRVRWEGVDRGWYISTEVCSRLTKYMPHSRIFFPKP